MERRDEITAHTKLGAPQVGLFDQIGRERFPWLARWWRRVRSFIPRWHVFVDPATGIGYRVNLNAIIEGTIQRPDGTTCTEPMPFGDMLRSVQRADGTNPIIEQIFAQSRQRIPHGHPSEN